MFGQVTGALPVRFLHHLAAASTDLSWMPFHLWSHRARLITQFSGFEHQHACPFPFVTHP